jgi:hypothetical protein
VSGQPHIHQARALAQPPERGVWQEPQGQPDQQHHRQHYPPHSLSHEEGFYASTWPPPQSARIPSSQGFPLRQVVKQPLYRYAAILAWLEEQERPPPAPGTGAAARPSCRVTVGPCCILRAPCLTFRLALSVMPPLSRHCSGLSGMSTGQKNARMSHFHKLVGNVPLHSKGRPVGRPGGWG